VKVDAKGHKHDTTADDPQALPRKARATDSATPDKADASNATSRRAVKRDVANQQTDDEPQSKKHGDIGANTAQSSAIGPKQKLDVANDVRLRQSYASSHESFSRKVMDSGEGLKYHVLSNVFFRNANDSNKYLEDTGLRKIETKQKWSGAPSEGVMYISRRGSISGSVENGDGSVSIWRLHSLPMSESLKDTGSTTQDNFLKKYTERAGLLKKRVTNSNGKKTTVNLVISDFLKIKFNSNAKRFEATESTHAMGVSGIGRAKQKDPKLDKADAKLLYAPSIKVAKERNDGGKEPRPEQTYHSEPMAIALHNSWRTTSMEKDSSLIGIVASFPNQVCKHCGFTLSKQVGVNSVISGVPGLEFGGQKAGPMYDKNTGTTVNRAIPAEILLTKEKATNETEIGNIYKAHATPKGDVK
jgi:hypothetical protein